MTQILVDEELEREIEGMAPRPALGNQMYLRPDEDVQAQIKAIAKRKRVKDQVVIRALLRLGLRRQPKGATQ
jgi:hypothetical protein